MIRTKRAALEAAGFRVGNAEDFLRLTPEEQRMVELRVTMARAVRRLRAKMHLSRGELAKRIQSSQSRVAKFEAAAEGSSLDLSFRSSFALGGKLSDLAKPARQTAPGSRRPKERGKAKQ